MIYLIGGASRVGKSKMALEMILQKPMQSFSLDFLYNLNQIKKLDNFSSADILEKGRLFYSTLKEILVNVSYRSKDCVIDGEVILPEFISELAQEYDIRSCFLGLSKTNIEEIIKYGGHFNWPKWKVENGLEKEVNGLAERTIHRSLIIQEEAKKYSLSYYDLSLNYKVISTEAINYLLS